MRPSYAGMTDNEWMGGELGGELFSNDDTTTTEGSLDTIYCSTRGLCAFDLKP